MMEKRGDAAVALVCAAVVLLSIALCHPVAESGVNDDWSYAKTALDLAETGQLLYHGWARSNGRRAGSRLRHSQLDALSFFTRCTAGAGCYRIFPLSER
jgi:hypothetical protein